ncbi:MAG: Fpg/Nei family DNA glycosylase [Candidatus Eisenbacteria bacterium]|nr:Fpg/Nei family DNA glycosylase [Candidatus Eisenbacteria bacterium]
MPELPEIANRASEMRKHLTGRTITGIEVLQPKCLNVSKRTFSRRLKGSRFEDVSHRGKWIVASMSEGYLFINLGMGGDLLLVPSDELPEKRRVTFHLDDGTSLAVNFWWFGHTHVAARLEDHAPIAKLGPDVLDLTKRQFRELVGGRRGGVKSFLLNQERIAGIGNAYVHDILFLAGLHPLRTLDSLTDEEIDGLWKAIRDGLKPSLRKGGAFYERDLFGRPGRFSVDDLLVAYREGKACPTCGTAVEKLKVGSTTSFICPTCQPRPRAKKSRRTKARRVTKKRASKEK